MRVDQVGLFFDRTHTLNIEVDFLTCPEELQLIPNIARVMREANELGATIVEMTNHTGIAPVVLAKTDLAAFHTRLIHWPSQHQGRQA